MAKVKECRCIIKHVTSEAERKRAVSNLNNARRTGDTTTVMILLAALTGKCPAKLRVCKVKR